MDTSDGSGLLTQFLHKQEVGLIMEVTYRRCCGLDVHKKVVVACLLLSEGDGPLRKEVRSFNTMTQNLLELADWLTAANCTHVALESTGVYWKPIFNLLEGQFEVLLVNAAHVKAVPGRKTDVRDSEWLADLLRHGLLKASFIPPSEQRELRELTRYRASLVGERARLINRLQKVLEDANLKLASVATDVSGVSARTMLKAIAEGETEAAKLAELARGRMRHKIAELEQALSGRVKAHHRFMLAQQLAHLDYLEEQIEAFSQEITRRMELLSQDAAPQVEGEAQSLSVTEPVSVGEALSSSGLNKAELANQNEVEPTPEKEEDKPKQLTYIQALILLDTIAGINRRIAEIIVAEIGINMGRFPSAAHLASWAGVCPGNHQSGGKRLSGKTRKGSQWLRQALIEAAQGAMRTKECYLSARGKRLSARRGKKKAVMAVAHSILVIVYHVLSRGESYQELGESYFDERARAKVERRLVGRLERLGYQVSLQPRESQRAAS